VAATLAILVALFSAFAGLGGSHVAGGAGGIINTAPTVHSDGAAGGIINAAPTMHTDGAAAGGIIN
jgi:hypothetical protein